MTHILGADPQLGQCSLAARGLWIELIALMHKSEQYGFLLVSGGKPTPKLLATLCRTDVKLVNNSLSELRAAKVFSEDENGVIYSRRMVADHAKALKDQQNGRGGGNPNLVKEVNRGDNPQDNQSLRARIKPRSQKPEARSREEYSPYPQPAGSRTKTPAIPPPLAIQMNNKSNANVDANAIQNTIQNDTHAHVAKQSTIHNSQEEEKDIPPPPKQPGPEKAGRRGVFGR